jgi:hypothetical protein
MRRSSEATLTTALAALTLGALALGCAKSETASSGPAKAGGSATAAAATAAAATAAPGESPSTHAQHPSKVEPKALPSLAETARPGGAEPLPPGHAPIASPTASPTVSTAVSVAPAGDASPRLLELGERAEIDKALGRFTVDYTQTFRLHLNGFGECTFASTTYKDNNVGDYIVVADGKTYPLPQHPDAKSWARHAVLGVWFGKLDRDDLLDVIAIAEHMTGAGPQGARPFPVVTYYFATGPKSFRLDEGLSKKATDKGLRSLSSAKQLATDGR